jgi:hypothetical protein
MLNYITSIFGKAVNAEPRYTVMKNPEGRWGIYDADGFALADYSRRTDAIRGAARRGYELA